MAELTIYEKYAKEGEAAVKAGNYREAEACWYTAMKIAEYFGEHDPRLTESMEQLAAVYSHIDRARESEKLKAGANKNQNQNYWNESATTGSDESRDEHARVMQMQILD